MNKNSTKRLLPFILCIVLIAAMALLATGCSDKNTTETPNTSASAGGTEQNADSTGSTGTAQTPEIIEKGEGATSFQFQVTDLDGTVTKFLIKTDKKTVGDALLELGLITGDNGPYGLYVKSVNGITADYDKDRTYWAFHINGEYASTGVDAAKITADTVYAFVRTKG